jgi:hypothetical protein
MCHGGDITGANTVRLMKMENSQGRGTDGAARFANMNLNDSRPNESMRDHGVRAHRVVRGIRTLRAGTPATAKTWTLWTDAGETKFEGSSSFQIAPFVKNHPIIAIVILSGIEIIGFICILQLPIQ